MLRALFFAGFANALLPITVFDNRFYVGDQDYTKPGKQFEIIGVDYQLGGSSAFHQNGNSDVLSDAEVCLRDAYVLQQLGANTIRVYAASPWLNHDKCMTIFNNAGIYVMLDLNNPYVALTRSNTSASYNSGLLNNAFGLIDAFKNYPNTLGFFSGNELVNDAASATEAPKYLRAFQRDLKQYIAIHANRTIPVGYSAADDTKLRVAMWEYLQCGNDDSKSDFYGINSYEWCSGVNDWTSSGYASVRSTFLNSSIPIFFSEYGCNKQTPRTFDEVTGGVYKSGSQGLLDVLSGGLVYEYSNESNNYGLVDVDSNGEVTYRQDFYNLKSQFASISISASAQPKTSSIAAPSCASTLPSGLDSSFGWDMDLPDCPDLEMLKNGGGNNNIGSIVDVADVTVKYSVYDTASNAQKASPTFPASNMINWQSNVPARTTALSSSSTRTASSGASSSAARSSHSSSKNGAEAYMSSTFSLFAALLALF